MSENTWPPHQEPPPEAQWPHPQPADENRFSQYPVAPRNTSDLYAPYGSQPPQPPSSNETDSGYGQYGAPGPSSAGRASGWPPPQGEPWPQRDAAPAPEQYHPRYPPPYFPQYPEAPRGAPYGISDPYAVRDPYSNLPPEGPRSRYSLVEIVMLVVIAIIIGAGGVWALTRYGPLATTQPTRAPGTAATGTAASLAQGTPPAGFHSYTNTTLGVQFDVPEGWTTQDKPTSLDPGVQVTSPSDMALILVGAIAIPNGQHVDEVAAANGAMAGAVTSGTVENKEGPTQVPFAGVTWVREAEDITHASTESVHMVVFVATHSTRLYLFVFFTPAATFAADNTDYFKTTTQSFRFLT